MTELEITSEMTAIEKQMNDLRAEIDTAETIHAEAPYKTEWSSFKHDDAVFDAGAKIAKLQERYDELDMMIADDEFELPPANAPAPAPNKIALFATYSLAAIGFITIGLLLSAAFILDDKDLMWNNVESFWRQLI